MKFLRASIDRAIIITQYDLRGFGHPVGVRLEHMSSDKSLSATVVNLVSFAATKRFIEDEQEDPGRIDGYKYIGDCTPEESAQICQAFADHCTMDQEEAVRLILDEIALQEKTMRDQHTSGQRDKIYYLETDWYKLIMTSLVEAFKKGKKVEAA